MKKNKYFNLFLIFSILIISCSSDKRNKHIEVLANQISEQLLDWKLSNNIVVEKDNKTLSVSIFYKGTDDSSFFLDHESNNMILAMLGYNFYDELKSFETINFQLKFEGYPDILHISMDQSRLQNNYDNFNASPVFYDFVEYSFIHLGYIGVLRLTQLTKHLNKIINEIFNFEGSFWDLLYIYSKECERTEKSHKNVYHFILVISAVEELDEFRSHKFNQGSFKYYLESCGYDETLLEKNPIEIMKYLHND